jgi:hypothetical protein
VRPAKGGAVVALHGLAAVEFDDAGGVEDDGVDLNRGVGMAQVECLEAAFGAVVGGRQVQPVEEMVAVAGVGNGGCRPASGLEGLENGLAKVAGGGLFGVAGGNLGRPDGI